MNIEAGLYYKTRDGRKSFVVSTGSPLGDLRWPICGYIEGVECAMSWTPEGRCYGVTEHPNDLVDKWKEPERRKAKVYLNRSVTGEVFPSVHTSESMPLGTKTVELVEGVFE